MASRARRSGCVRLKAVVLFPPRRDQSVGCLAERLIIGMTGCLRSETMCSGRTSKSKALA
eukprot:12454054-Alexandrium_andersonii.AAC.1